MRIHSEYARVRLLAVFSSHHVAKLYAQAARLFIQCRFFIAACCLGQAPFAVMCVFGVRVVWCSLCAAMGSNGACCEVY